MPEKETRLAFVDGRDALAIVVIRPNATGDGVNIEASANGLDQKHAARILRRLADQWDPPAEPEMPFRIVEHGDILFGVEPNGDGGLIQTFRMVRFNAAELEQIAAAVWAVARRARQVEESGRREAL